MPVTFYNLANLSAYNMSLNLFSTETNKLTYSFEKAYYTRSVEFSDYLRTEYDLKEPIVIYFLNHTGNKETIVATLPIWLDKIPVSVAGAVYDAKYLKDIVFTDNCELKNENCMDVCNSNVTCYLVDEHGIIVLSNNNETNETVGSPLYKVNPWLMLQLESDGVYDLIVPGKLLQDCNVVQQYGFNSASISSNILTILKSTIWITHHLIFNVFNYIG